MQTPQEKKDSTGKPKNQAQTSKPKPVPPQQPSQKPTYSDQKSDQKDSAKKAS